MGIIFSHFKKKVSTKEKLQKIQEDINLLQEYKEHTEQRRRKLVGSLVIYSFIFTLIGAIICYFYYLPPTIKEKLLYATPFAGFIVFINLIKSILTWYYGWKVRRNENKLTSLKENKKKLLEDVMETETYKVAKDILETFAPEQLMKTQSIRTPISTPVNQQRMSRPEAGSELRRRIVSTPQSHQMGPPATSTRFSSATPMTRPNEGFPPVRAASNQNVSPPTPFFRGSPNRPAEYDSGIPPGPPMPRPILPRERGILDRFVEYLVGDGPSNRFALVCRQCESHNGMALKDEFLYIAFRCAYCHYWNPARKQKPAPPRLETVNTAEILARKLREEKESSEEEGEDNPTSSEDKEVGKQNEKLNPKVVAPLETTLPSPESSSSPSVSPHEETSSGQSTEVSSPLEESTSSSSDPKETTEPQVSSSK